MGKGICADSYVGKPDEQYWFRITFGGSGEYPREIRKRLDEAKRKKNNRSRARRAKKRITMNNSETNNSINPTNESINDKRLDLSTLPNHNLLLSKKEAGSA